MTFIYSKRLFAKKTANLTGRKTGYEERKGIIFCMLYSGHVLFIE